MDARLVRNSLPALYAAAIVLALLFANTTVFIAVIIVGAMIVGAGYVGLSGRAGGTSPNPERAARRAVRRDRRR